MQSISNKQTFRIFGKDIILFLFFFLVCVFHYRIYYLLGISGSIYVEAGLVFITILFLIHFLGKIRSWDEFFAYIGATATVVFLYHLFGNAAVENKFFYEQVSKEYDVVYSSILESCSYSSRTGTSCHVKYLNDETESTFVRTCSEVPDKKYNLIVYPKLAHDGEFGYYSVYHKRLYSNRPTDPQLEYCRNGARLSKKIDYLRHSGAASMREFKTYLSGIISHDNRMISGVIEKKGEKYLFVNALQSENKLWAIKYRNVDDGKKVLMIYEVNSPSLFAVIDWNPTDEDYDYYNTNEGRKPAFKYLLKLDAIASSSSSMEMEEKTDFEE